MPHTITGLALLLCALLCAPAWAGPTFIRYRTASGEIGFAQDRTGVPPGAEIIRDAPKSEGSLSTISGPGYREAMEARKRRLERLDEERAETRERRATAAEKSESPARPDPEAKPAAEPSAPAKRDETPGEKPAAAPPQSESE